MEVHRFENNALCTTSTRTYVDRKIAWKSFQINFSQTIRMRTLTILWVCSSSHFSRVRSWLLFTVAIHFAGTPIRRARRSCAVRCRITEVNLVKVVYRHHKRKRIVVLGWAVYSLRYRNELNIWVKLRKRFCSSVLFHGVRVCPIILFFSVPIAVVRKCGNFLKNVDFRAWNPKFSIQPTRCHLAVH